MNKLFKLTCFIILLHQIISGQESPKKIFFADSNVNIELLESQYCAEGFLQGTLVKTINGYIPIESISVGDILVGIEGTQEVLSIKKGKVDRYVRLFLMNGDYINAAMHQNLYLHNETLYPAAGLIPGNRLLDGLYIIDNEIIDEPCNCYSLTTENHIFFIYPNILVHNFDIVTISSIGSCIIGAVEVSNPVTILLGIIVPLAVYATRYFESNIMYKYQSEEKDINIPIQQLCLQNNEVMQKAREYYDTKRRALNSLYQDLIKIKNDISAFVKPNYTYKFDFSFELLSQYKPVIYNTSALIPLASEMALSLDNKERLMQMRQDELDKLQQDIFDIHLALVLHITELIDQRYLAKQLLDEVAQQVSEEVIVWNENLYNIPIDVAFAHYKTLFIWQEMLNNFELKINELKFVMSYYEKLKSHFFMTKTTNLLDVFHKETITNKAYLESIVNSRASWFSNIKITEDFLRARNLLTHQFVEQYKIIGKQYRAEKEKNNIILAQKKKESMKDLIKKELEKKKNSGGGGPEKDPLQEKNDFWEKLQEKSDKEGFHFKFGKLLRDAKTRLWWAKDTANHGGPHFKVFREAVKGLEWLFNANIYGEQIMNQHKGLVGLLIPYNEIRFL